MHLRPAAAGLAQTHPQSQRAWLALSGAWLALLLSCPLTAGTAGHVTGPGGDYLALALGLTAGAMLRASSVSSCRPFLRTARAIALLALVLVLGAEWATAFITPEPVLLPNVGRRNVLLYRTAARPLVFVAGLGPGLTLPVLKPGSSTNRTAGLGWLAVAALLGFVREFLLLSPAGADALDGRGVTPYAAFLVFGLVATCAVLLTAWHTSALQSFSSFGIGLACFHVVSRLVPGWLLFANAPAALGLFCLVPTVGLLTLAPPRQSKKTRPPAPPGLRLAEEWKLTPRETEVLGLVCAGLGPKEIAAHLSLAPSTVRVHLHNIHGKAKVENSRELKALIAEACDPSLAPTPPTRFGPLHPTAALLLWLLTMLPPPLTDGSWWSGRDVVGGATLGLLFAALWLGSQGAKGQPSDEPRVLAIVLVSSSALAIALPQLLPNHMAVQRGLVALAACLASASAPLLLATEPKPLPLPCASVLVVASLSREIRTVAICACGLLLVAGCRVGSPASCDTCKSAEGARDARDGRPLPIPAAGGFPCWVGVGLLFEELWRSTVSQAHFDFIWPSLCIVLAAVVCDQERRERLRLLGLLAALGGYGLWEPSQRAARLIAVYCLALLVPWLARRASQKSGMTTCLALALGIGSTRYLEDALGDIALLNSYAQAQYGGLDFLQTLTGFVLALVTLPMAGCVLAVTVQDFTSRRAQELTEKMPDSFAARSTHYLQGRGLSEPQALIVTGLAQGEEVSRVAQRLHYSESTVKSARAAAYVLLGVRNRASLAKHLLEMVGEEPPDPRSGNPFNV